MPGFWRRLLPVLIAAPAFAGTGEAVSRALPLFDKAAREWKVPCLSCHHQALGMLVADSARRRGLPVDEAAAQAQAARTLAPLLASAESALAAPVDVFGMGYGLLAAHAAGVRPNLVTSVVARRFANWQLPDGHWAANDARPPMSASEFTATALAVRAILLYLPDSLAAERHERFARARKWFLAAKPRSTEDRTFQVLGLLWAAASPAERRGAIDGLIAAQRADGGWAQENGMESDAYATGEAVYALRASAPGEEAARRGARFLRRTQQPGGSWLVKTRLHSPARISPPFFDSGFPNGRDQYSSFAGTAWALLGLMECLPPAAPPARPLPLADAAPKDAQPWMEKALFGSVDDLKALLDAGIAAQALLPWAQPDAAKTALLLERGARADDRSAAIAATYRDSASALTALLSHGAKATDEALGNAAMTGDVEAAKVLLAHGAHANSQPLLAAVSSGHAEMVRLLVQNGADPNQKGQQGMTPLMTAALMHRTRVVRVLMELGADPAAVDDFGHTALQHTSDIRFASPKTASVLRRARVYR